MENPLNAPVPDLPLRDIHLPDPISWWPPAIGWWILLTASLVILILAIWAIRTVRKPTLKKTARKEFKLILDAFEANKNPTECVANLSLFLRRVVLTHKRKDLKTAGMTGIPWLKYLDQFLDEPEFSSGAGRILLTGPYQRQIDNEAAIRLIKLCEKWVQRL